MQALQRRPFRPTPDDAEQDSRRLSARRAALSTESRRNRFVLCR
jgi:hypothetical protein